MDVRFVAGGRRNHQRFGQCANASASIFLVLGNGVWGALAGLGNAGEWLRWLKLFQRFNRLNRDRYVCGELHRDRHGPIRQRES